MRVSSEIGRQLIEMLPRLRRFAIGLTGNASDGDDLVQACYERALRYLDSYEPGTRLDSWLFRIARNIHLNELRARAVRARHLQTVAADGEPEVDGARTMEGRLTLAAVRNLLGRLPEEQRSALLLVAVDGLSYAETAKVLALPIGTVTSRVARARIALKARLDGAESPPGEERGHEVFGS